MDTQFGPKVLHCIKKATGAKKVFWLSHQRRSEEERVVPGKRTQGRPAIGFCHTDYGKKFEGQLRTMLVERFKLSQSEANSCGLVLCNLWSPIINPAYRSPLALLDGSTVDFEEDCVEYIVSPSLDTGYAYYNGKHRRPKHERVPQAAKDAPALSPVYRPNHQWVYLSDQAPSEAMIFKQFDFRPYAKTKGTFHVAIPDDYHKEWKDCPGRKSIECRVVLIFENENYISTSKSSKL